MESVNRWINVSAVPGTKVNGSRITRVQNVLEEFSLSLFLESNVPKYSLIEQFYICVANSEH